MLDDLLEGFEIFPGFKTPSNSGNSRDILEYIDSEFPQVRAHPERESSLLTTYWSESTRSSR